MKTIVTACTFLVLLVLTFAIIVGNPSGVSAEPKMVFGEPQALGQGSVRSWVKINDQGKPSSLGVIFAKDALSGLPSGEFPTEVTLALPEGVAVAPFNHISVDWNPHGHEPPNVYDIPHFDIHFYMISGEERNAIGPNDAEQFAKAPAEAYLPTDYQPAPGGVPRMGAHWMDMTSPEFQGKPFTTTFIFGTYDGVVNFYEPMVAQDFLESSSDFSAPIKQPAAFQKSGYYPKMYRIRYNEKTEKYSIFLDELSYH